MKLIESKAELIRQKPGLCGIYEQIEMAGRTCYKSEGKMAENHKAFVDRMIKSKHYAMLEHGTVYFWNPVNSEDFQAIRDKYSANKYSEVRADGQAITTNYRVIIENGWEDDMYMLIDEPTEYHAKRITMRFTCDRGISHELVRHRVFSFAQESTRYCNYSKGKFGSEITYILPTFLKSQIEPGQYNFDSKSFKAYTGDTVIDLDENSNRVRFIWQCLSAEMAYKDMLDNSLSPQEARSILPNCLKTEVVMTGFLDDWKHFFDLRLKGTTGKPHPDMENLASKAYAVLTDASYYERVDKPLEGKFEALNETSEAPSEAAADMVNHPPHYEGKFECIDVMGDCYGDEAVKAFCLGNAFKYIYRCNKKFNKLEDVEKAIWYLNKYVSMERKRMEEL